MMSLLRQIFTQLGNTFKLAFLVVKNAKMGRFKKSTAKKTKSYKSSYMKSLKGAKSSFSKKIKKVATAVKRERSKLLSLRSKISKLMWKNPIKLFSLIVAVLGLSGALALYQFTDVGESPVYTLAQNQPVAAETISPSPEDLNTYQELSEPPKPKVAIQTELVVETEVKVEEVIEKAPVEQLQPYFTDDETPALIKTINPQFLVEVPPTDNQRVGIVLTGLGINKQLTQDVLDELQADDQVTLGFSPYADNIGEQISYARHEGYTTLLTMPLEDDNPKTDQGFLTLRTKKSAEINLQNLTVLFTLAGECEGFYGEGGNRLLRSAEDFEPFAEWVVNNKNLFLAPPDVLMTRLHEVGSKLKLNYACTTVVNPSLSSLSGVSSLAKRTGFAIVSFTIKPNIVDEINEWIIRLEADNINVVPITEIIPIREKR